MQVALQYLLDAGATLEQLKAQLMDPATRADLGAQVGAEGANQ